MEERSQEACPHCGVLLGQHEGACGTRRNLFVKGENDMTIDNEIKPRQTRPKNPARVSVTKDIRRKLRIGLCSIPGREPSTSSARSLPWRWSGIPWVG